MPFYPSDWIAQKAAMGIPMTGVSPTVLEIKTL